MSSLDPVARGLAAQARTAAIPAIYMGQVATRTRFPSYINNSFAQSMSRRGDFIREAVATNTMRLVFANAYTLGNGEFAPGFALTLDAVTVEYPAGTYTDVTFSGSTSATMADGLAQLVSDPVNVAIPRGAQIWINTHTTGAGVIANNYGYRSAVGDKFAIGATTPDMTHSSAWTGTGGFCYGPTAIIAPTRRTSVAVVADSRGEGAGDPGGQFASSHYVGEIVPTVAPLFGTLDLSRSSSTAYEAVAGGFAKRGTYLQYVSHAINELGINDVKAAIRTAAQLLADRQWFATSWPNVKWWQTTMSPNTTSTTPITALTSSGTTATATIAADKAAALAVGQSVTIAGAVPAGYNGAVAITAISGQQISYTLLAGATGLATATTNGTLSDGWASIAFQTKGSQESARIAVNDACRQGVPNYQGCFDIADASESFRNSGFWKVPPQAPGITTIDGLHGGPIEWTLTPLYVNPALLTR